MNYIGHEILPRLRHSTHDIRVLDGSLFAVAHWNDGFIYEIPTLLAAVHKGHEAAASGTVQRPLPLWNSSRGTHESRQGRITVEIITNSVSVRGQRYVCVRAWHPPCLSP